MTDTKITIVCKEGEYHITDISLTAERNYTPIFTEAFSTQEKPLSVYLIKNKDILSENAAKSGAKQILSNLTELIRNSLKMRARVECKIWDVVLRKDNGISYIDSDDRDCLFKTQSNPMLLKDCLIETLLWLAKEQWHFKVEEEFDFICNI